MRILLVNPPRSHVNLIHDFSPEHLKEQTAKISIVGPPLSLCALAGNLRGHTVEIYDLKAEYDLGLGLPIEEAIRNKLLEFGPDIAGVTVLASEYNGACRILKTVKAFDERILTVAGGIHATLCPMDFELPYVDISVQGPGKKIFADIVNVYRDKKDFMHIPNITIRVNENFVRTRKEKIFENKDNILSHVFSDRALVKKYDAAYVAGISKNPISYIETSYGCANACTFCSIWPATGGGYFRRNVRDVISELETMKEYEVVRFADANTFGDVEYADLLLDRIIERGLQRILIADMRADTIVKYPDLVRKAADAGLKVAIVGIESCDDEKLASYNKGSSAGIALKAKEVLEGNGVFFRSLFIIEPDFTEGDFGKVSGFIDSNNMNHSAFSIMTPIPGTILHKRLLERITVTDLDYYTFFNAVLPTKLPEAEFYAHIAELYKDKVGTR